MADKPDRTKQLSDATVSIYHDAKRFENNVCDWMVVQHFRGNEEDVVIYKQNGEPRVARLRRGLTMERGLSPAIPVSTSGTEWLEPVDAKDEKRLLAIYELVEATPQIS